ncbi:MAG: gamma-glutamyltranspeptidase/glutathione hydrolase, partial [Gammaproteobacteria bacterium]
MIKFNAVIIGLFSSFMANSPVFSNEPVQPESGDQISHKTTVNSNSFMLSAANPLAAKAGHEVLSRGGTAMDAAVAVQFVLNLVEPQSSGIGGGAFLLYWEQASQQLYTLDGRETAPASARPDQFLEADGTPQKWWKRITGGLSVGVPGTLRLLETAHKKFGNQTWSGLLQPAVELAENGFLVSPRMAHSIEKSADRGLKNFTPTRDYFFDDNGEPLVADHLLLNKEFAKTLRKIQISGATEFYAGSIGEALVNTVNNASANPASMTMQDLANYQVKFRPAVCGSYRGYQICGMGPPTSGGLTVAQILGMLDHHEISGTDFNAENVHLIVEAQKLAYADRAKYIADSDFVPVPAYGLLSSDYLAKRASLINRQSAMQKAEAGEPDWLMSADSYASIYHRELTGTSHFSIVDQYGNAVSMTTTIESGFGSRLMSGGFLLNNELTDFSALPEKDGVPVANRIEPGK